MPFILVYKRKCLKKYCEKNVIELIMKYKLSVVMWNVHMHILVKMFRKTESIYTLHIQAHMYFKLTLVYFLDMSLSVSIINRTSNIKQILRIFSQISLMIYIYIYKI